MVATIQMNRDTIIQRSERDVKRWNGLVETLLQAFGRNEEAPPALGSQMEALRNKRDTVDTKLYALKHHRNSGWSKARRELDEARTELRNAWRSVIGILDKESLFV